MRPPDLDRADRIGSYWGNPATRTFGELLIDREEDRTPQAVLVSPGRGGRRRERWIPGLGMLRLRLADPSIVARSVALHLIGFPARADRPEAGVGAPSR